MKSGGAGRVRTGDPLRARQVLSQLSYSPDPDCEIVEFENFTILKFANSPIRQSDTGGPG